MEKKKSSQASGGKRLVASGKHPVTLGLLPEQRDRLRAAAQAEGRPVTQFVIYHALQAAEKILKKTPPLS